MTVKFLGRLFPALVVALSFGAPLMGCDDLFDDDDDDGEEDDDDEVDRSDFCLAAEQIDDDCEAVNGEDVPTCAPFDDIDEACEVGSQDESCEAKAQLVVDCETVFGAAAPECSAAAGISDACS